MSFSYANATVSDFKFTNNKLSLTKDNFIIEDGSLKIGNNFDLSTIEAVKENETTLTFKLTQSSATPITKDSDTSTIYIWKMQTNIGTNQFVEKLKNKFDVSDNGLWYDANVSKLVSFAYDYGLSKDSNNFLVLTNWKEGQANNLIAMAGLPADTSYSNVYSNFHKIIKDNWQSFGDSFTIETSIENVTNGIVKLQFEPASFYEPYMFKFIMTNGKFVYTNYDGKPEPRQ